MLAKWNLTVSLLNIFHGALPSLFPNPLHPPTPTASRKMSFCPVIQQSH